MAFKNLILFAGAPPFRDLNTYLKTEIEYLSPHFETVQVLVNSDELPKIDFPKNVHLSGLTVNLTQGDKWPSLVSIFNPQVIKELVNFPSTLAAYKSIFNHFTSAKKLVASLKEMDLDLEKTLFYCYWTDYRAIGLALMKKKYPQLKFVTRMHGWDIYWERHAEKYLPFRKLLFDEADSIFFVSNNGRKYFQKSIGIGDNPKLKTHYLGVKDNGLNPTEKPYDNTLHLVSCSFSIKLKRVDLIAEALKEIDNINVKWTHIGGGRTQEYFQQKAYAFLKEKTNIKYQFLGEMSQNDVMEHYQHNHYDLFINVSEFEGIPIGMMEALSFGIPLMGTKTGGVSEIIQQDENGLLLPNHPSANEIAQQIVYFNRLSEEERLAYRTNARRVWNEKFNADKNYGAFIKDIFALSHE